MITSREYKDLLASGIVSTEMMCDALFSLNKRAKNYRDAARDVLKQYRSYGTFWDGNRTSMNEMYAKKERLLAYLRPVCIHKEFAGFERVRVYDYEQHYQELYIKKRLCNKVVWQNSYCEGYHIVHFFDYETDEPKFRYYLYYVCGDHTFHTPIEKSDVKKYNLVVITIDTIYTEGHECQDLMSMQFVNKILKALDEHTAVYRSTAVDVDRSVAYLPDENRQDITLTIMDLQDVMALAAPDLVYQFRKVHKIHSDPELFDDLRKKFSVKQKLRKKIGVYRQPNVTISGKYQPDPCKRFYSVAFLESILDKLNSVTDEEERYGLFLQLCLSDESLVYEDIYKDLQYDASMLSVRSRMQYEAKVLYEADPTRRIINKDGVLDYE